MKTSYLMGTVLLLAAMVSSGAATKCYMGTEGTDVAIDCTGSCTRTTFLDNDEYVMLACWPVQKDPICVQTRQTLAMETCYCSTDYCNTSMPASLPSLFIVLLSSLLPLLRGIF